jgi:hypothetical protein
MNAKMPKDRNAQYRELALKAIRLLSVKAKTHDARMLVFEANRWLERELIIAAAARSGDREQLLAALLDEAAADKIAA